MTITRIHFKLLSTGEFWEINSIWADDESGQIYYGLNDYDETLLTREEEGILVDEFEMHSEYLARSLNQLEKETGISLNYTPDTPAIRTLNYPSSNPSNPPAPSTSGGGIHGFSQGNLQSA